MEKKKNQNYRIIFLKRFTKEILINIQNEQKSKERIEIERLKHKLSPAPSEDFFKKMIRSRINSIHEIKGDYNPSIKGYEKRSKPAEFLKPLSNQITNEESIIKKPLNKIIEEKKQSLNQMNMAAEPDKEESNLGKIEPLIKDNSIQLIECPGPGKSVLIKRYNQVNLSKIILNQDEINNIIDYFSKQTQIPVEEGILKASIGNLIISAVISEFVGSRFIINKTTPLSLITGQ